MHGRSSAALLGAAILLASCGMASNPSSAPSSNPERSVPVATTDAKAVGAKELYDAARAEALKLASDSVLIRAQNTRWPDFEAHLPPDGKVPEWLYTFASASQKKEFHIAASTLKVEKRFEFDLNGTPEEVPADWIDSIAAFEATLASGGSDFLASHATYPVYFTLEYDQGTKGFVWDVKYSAFVREGLYGFLVSATEARVLQMYGTGSYSDLATPKA